MSTSGAETFAGRKFHDIRIFGIFAKVSGKT